MRQHSGILKQINIQNAAVFVLDNQTNEVIAYVGSANFHDKKDAGQVDGIRAIRSPGSTLKPLIYTMAFEEGILTPQKQLLDVPLNFGGFAPQNFDEKYQGKVSVTYALANSLNIPAVWTLEQLNEKKVIEKLKNAQFKQITKDQRKLGLSLALGGCGVSLEELTKLYAAFAHKGIYRHCKWLQDKEGEKVDSFELLNPAAVYMTTNILTKVERPDLPNLIAETVGLPRIAWKTGTSYGRKDAWSIGYNSRYTVGVWVGNFSGQGVPELTGASKAAPLLFEVFNLLDRSSPRLWNVPPENLDHRWVCSESGEPANDFCEHTRMDDFIPLVSNTKKCQHLKSYWVSTDTTMSYCTRCLPQSGYQRLNFDHPKPALAAFYRETLINYNPPPIHNPKCENAILDDAPKITSLIDELQYLLTQSDNDELMLQCQAANDVQKVSWFVNDVYLKTVRSNEKLFFKPKAGPLKISCADDKGRNSDISIQVKYY